MRFATTVALACLSLSPSLATHVEPSTPHTVQRTVYLMGTRATLTVERADRGAALHQLEQMVQGLERTEAELSTWRRESVLSTLNRQPVGKALEVSAGVCALWPKLTAWHRDTVGAFDPAVGALVEAWGLRDAGRLPSSDELAAARAVTGWAHFRFVPATCRVTRRLNATLDAGAFGTGEALRRLMLDDGAGGPWMVDVGGQIAVSGSSAAGVWRVAVAHPARRDESALEIALAGGSLATSGGSERSYDVEGQSVGHILDPRTGQPVQRPESVSVWHEDPLAADVLSTALYVMGPQAGLRFADANGLAALFLARAPEEGAAVITARVSSGFRRQFPSVHGVVGATATGGP